MMTTKTPIYSPFPVEPTSPSVAEAISLKILRNEIPREHYPALPWSIEDLVGSQWRNIHTGTLNAILRIEEGNRWLQGKIIPCFSSRFGYLDTQESPGFWWGTQFLIEHWVRLDHWPAERQLYWFAVELRHHRQEIRRYEDQIAAIDAHADMWRGTGVMNKNSYKRDIQSHQRELKQAIERMRQFAMLHHLEIALALLNSGVGQTEHPAQLTLF